VKRTNEDQISKGALPHFGGLLPIHEMAATVLLPTGFVVFLQNGLSLPWLIVLMRSAVIPAAINPFFTALYACPPRQCCIRLSPLVTMTFNCEIEARMLRKERRVSLHGPLLVRANLRFVKIEIDVLDVLVEQILIRPAS
jgi:hypothetical protein